MPGCSLRTSGEGNRWAGYGRVRCFIVAEVLDFEDAVKVWIIERQMARRNLTKYQKSKLALAYEPILKEQAKKRQGQRNDLCQISDTSEPKKKRRAIDDVAEIAGVSHDTIAKVKKIEDAADDDLKEQLEEGKISINKAYNSLFGEKTPDTVKIIGKKGLHVEGKMPDVQESFPVVLDLLEDVARNYLVSLEHADQQTYTKAEKLFFDYLRIGTFFFALIVG